MDDGNKPPHSMGGGQQRTHPRPFFYVQPPSQPYYLYQHWQMNNPYGHYGLPAGFNFGRPCLHPYQYMQYPGFVFPPHAPLYPMDYRRMFEPRFHSPHWSDASGRFQQQPPPQPPGQPRETASSEAQTDPSDAITKLIQCLDKMQTGDVQGADRELDSGVASQSSGMFSPTEEKKTEKEKVGRSSAPNESCFETPTATFSASTIAVYDGDSSHRSLDVLSPPECWSGDLEEELPLDSSSVHEDGPDSEQKMEEQVVPVEKEVADIQTDIVATDQNVPTCDEQTTDEKSVDVKTDQEASKSKEDQSFQILKLPFESVLASGASGSSRVSSSPYYYNYLSMPTSHERLSVLSPSLDELSSKDEMFSTDLEDVELFPKHVYGGRRMAEVVCGAAQTNEDVEEVWALGSKRFVCACCGKSLPKGAARSKVHCAKMYLDDGADSDEEGRYVRGCEPIRVVVRKHTGPRKTHPLPQRHTAKSWYKRGQYTEQPDPEDEGREPHDQEGAEVCQSQGNLTERLCRDEPAVSEQSRWAEGGVVPRRRQTAPLQRQEMNQRKVMYHRPRDDDGPPPLHWDRGSPKV